MNDIGTDWRANYTEAPSVDPMRQTPAPAVVDVEGIGRVETLRWTWDYLANTTSWTDNDDAFYERSIGAIGNGNAAGESSGSRPSALYVASNLTAGVTGSSNGWVEVDYGVGGNVTGMTVHAQCTDGVSTCVDPGGDSDARRAALRANCDCATEQHYTYRWDELNRLAEARRYDYEGIAWVRKVRQRYRYDGANSRTVKQTLDSSANPERIALYPYPGDFERRGLTRGADAYEADGTLETETQYVVAGARMVWKHGAVGAHRGPHPDHRRGVRRALRRAAGGVDVLPEWGARDVPERRHGAGGAGGDGVHGEGGRRGGRGRLLRGAVSDPAARAVGESGPAACACGGWGRGAELVSLCEW